MLVAAMALVGAPAVALTAFCVGESCAQEDGVATAVPFCPLPADSAPASRRGSGRAGPRT